MCSAGNEDNINLCFFAHAHMFSIANQDVNRKKYLTVLRGTNLALLRLHFIEFPRRLIQLSRHTCVSVLGYNSNLNLAFWKLSKSNNINNNNNNFSTSSLVLAN